MANIPHRLPQLRVILIAVALVLPGGNAVFAQDQTRSSILGTVRDSVGAVVSGATVIVINTGTNVATQVVSNDSGAFEVPYLQPGTYSVSVNAQGFKKFVQQGIVVNVGSRANIDVTLEVGVVSEEVRVTAAAQLLETTSASGSAVLGNEAVRSMPVFGNMSALVVRSLPGIQWTGQPNYLALHSVVGASQISAAGGAGGNEFVLDGIPNTGRVRRLGFIPSTDAVDEVRVSSSEFDARQGHTANAVVNMVTKSGTNDFHGTLSYLHWQQRWNGTPTFTKAVRGRQIGAALAAGNTALADQLREQPLQTSGRSNTYAANIGGPLWLPHVWNGKDKLFFFFSFNGFRENKSEEVTAINRTVPTAAHRRGDFSDLLKLGPQYQIYDPRTARLVGGRVVRDPFPNNQVPILNPLYNAIVKLYPLPNNPAAGPADANNYVASATPFNWKYKAFQNRVDANTSSKSKLSGKWSYNDFLEDRGDWTYETARGLNSNGLVRRNIGIGVEYVRTLSTTTFLRFTAGYNRFIEGNQLDAVQTSFNAAKIGLPAYIDARAGTNQRLPNTNFSAYSNLSDAFPGFTRVSVADTAGEISRVFNRHTVRAGYDFRYNYNATNGPGNSEGQYQFRNSFVRACDASSGTAPCNLVNSAPAIGLEWAAFMLGVPTNVFIDRNDTLYMTSPFAGAYVQDDWRISQKLTLNLGFRYEIEGGFRERYNRGISQFDPNAQLPIADAAKAAYARNPIPELPISQFDVRGGSLYLGLNGAPGTLNASQPGYMPRIGVAYQWKSRTVLRAGYGLFYDTNNVLNWGLDQFGFNRPTSTILTTDGGLTLNNTNLMSAPCRTNPANCQTILSDPFPVRSDGTRFNDPLGNQLGLMARAGRGFTFVDRDWKRARQQRWRIGVERELSRNMIVEVAYLGSFTDNITSINTNPGDAQVTRRLDFLPRQYWVTGFVPNAANDAFLNTRVPNPFNISNFQFLQTQNPTLYQDMATNGFFTGSTILRSQLLRAFPHMNGLFIAREPDATLKYHHLETSFTRRFSHGLQLIASYQWASSQIRDFFQNEFDAKPVYRQNPNYYPHSFRLNGIFELPFGKGRRFLSNGGVFARLLGGWQAAPVYYLQSGRTYDFPNLIFFGSTRDIRLPKDQQNTDNWFNWRLFPSATRDFSTTNPQPYRDRIRQIVPQWFMTAIGKTFDNVVPSDFALDSFHTRIFPSRFNWLRGARMNQLDVNIRRTFPIKEKRQMEFSTDLINAFNHVQYDNPVTNPNSTDFGKVTQQWNTARWIQFKMRLVF